MTNFELLGTLGEMRPGMYDENVSSLVEKEVWENLIDNLMDQICHQMNSDFTVNEDITSWTISCDLNEINPDCDALAFGAEDEINEELTNIKDSGEKLFTKLQLDIENVEMKKTKVIFQVKN